MNKFYDIIIIGAGASGFSCACSALAERKSVCIIEHNLLPLKKVKISGGGKCNFTNLHTAKANYQTSAQNIEIIDNALKQFSPQNFLSIIKKYKIKFYEKEKGQLFAASSSQEIIDMLSEEAKTAKIFYNTKIISINKTNDFFSVETDKGKISAKSLVVATGGMSYPNIGASDFGYRIAKQFKIKIVPYKPALVPFNLDNETMKKTIKLKGVSLNADIRCNHRVFEGNILFTHFGLSGPAILKSSLFWNNGNKIEINMLPKIDLAKELKLLRDTSKGKKISNILTKYLPTRLVDGIVENKDCFISEASNKLIDEISKNINKWEIIPIGTQGFKLAEVTSGGVDLSEINDTFESKKISNLFFVGEVLDVAGQLGGYNLQWAWSSGFVAGKNA